jgi:hypothetical protein
MSQDRPEPPVMREPSAPSAPAGFVGGLLCGPVVALFFGVAMGMVLALPKSLEDPASLGLYLLSAVILGAVFGLPFGALLGGTIGVLNRRSQRPRTAALIAGSVVGLLVGASVGSVLFWHRLDIDGHFKEARAPGEYLTLCLTLFPLVGVMGLLAGLALGWAIGFTTRLRADYRRRVGYGVIAGAASGFLAGMCVVGIILLALAPAIERYGAW